LRTTKYKLTEIKADHPELFEELESLFGEFELHRIGMVEDYRKSAEVLADLDISKAMTIKSMGKFLRKAGEAIPMVKVEPQWWIYRTKEGEIILESAFTERDYRNAQRVQKAGLDREVSAEDADGLFEKDTNSDEPEEHLGF
jgi:hypothetical protein